MNTIVTIGVRLVGMSSFSGITGRAPYALARQGHVEELGGVREREPGPRTALHGEHAVPQCRAAEAMPGCGPVRQPPPAARPRVEQLQLGDLRASVAAGSGPHDRAAATVAASSISRKRPAPESARRGS